MFKIRGVNKMISCPSQNSEKCDETGFVILLPHMCYISICMCGPKGCGFLAILVRNRVFWLF